MIRVWDDRKVGDDSRLNNILSTQDNTREGTYSQGGTFVRTSEHNYFAFFAEGGWANVDDGIDVFIYDLGNACFFAHSV